MNKRHQFHGNAWETLEDRQLLSGGNTGGALARLLQRAAQFAPVNGAQGGRAGGPQGVFGAARGQGPRARFGMVPQGPVGAGFNTLQPNAAVNPQNARLNTPAPRQATAPPPTSVVPTGNSEYVLNPASLGLGSTGVPLNMAGGYAGLRPGSYAAGSSGLQAVTGSNGYRPPVTATAPVTNTVPAANTVPVGDVPAGSIEAAVSPASVPAIGGRMMAGPENMMIADPNFVPEPWDVLDGAVLTGEQVGALKTAAADLVANHTYGANAEQDKAAVDAFQGVLNDLAMSIWSQVNVTTTASADAMKDAAAAFAEDYTGGADPAADKAAWKAFNTALGDFTRSIKNPNAPETPRPEGPMYDDGPWLSMPMMGGGSNIKYLASGLLDGQPVNQEDLAGVLAAVNTFADAYTAGADKAKDLATGEALLNQIGTVMSKRWERLAPPEVVNLALAARSTIEAAPNFTLAAVNRTPVTLSMVRDLLPPVSKA